MTLAGFKKSKKTWTQKNVKQGTSKNHRNLFPVVTQQQQGLKLSGSKMVEGIWPPAVTSANTLCCSQTCWAFLPPPCHFSPVSGLKVHLNSSKTGVWWNTGNYSCLWCFFTNITKSGIDISWFFFKSYLQALLYKSLAHYFQNVEDWEGKWNKW